MKVFKVVKPIEGDLYHSCVARVWAGVDYRPGEWAEPPEWLDRRGYFLTAFSELEDAERFLLEVAPWNFPRPQVWEAEVDGVRKMLPPILVGDLLEERQDVFDCFSKWPKGTIMARRIKLIRRVAWVEGGELKRSVQ